MPHDKGEPRSQAVGSDPEGEVQTTAPVEPQQGEAINSDGLPSGISFEALNEWLDSFMAKGKPCKLAIIGPATAKHIVELPGRKLNKTPRGNAHQRRKYRRSWERQDAAIIALAKLPDDCGARLMVRTFLPR